MKNFLFGAACIAAVSFSSCIDMGERVNGNGNIKSENRKVSEADKISLGGDMDVYISEGPMALKVEADENLLPYIITEVEGGTLKIRDRDNVNINTSHAMKVYVTMPSVTDVRVGGSGNITFDKMITSDRDMAFAISGSGDITAQVNAPKTMAEISGSGNIHISGETKNVEIHIAGSGNYDGQELKAENAEVHIAGSGDAGVFADATLNASIAGSGTVKYKGNATVEKHISGSGSVDKE